MKVLFSLMLLLLLIVSGQSQNKNSYFLKAYNVTSVKHDYLRTYTATSNTSNIVEHSDIRILHPTVGLSWKLSNGNRRQIEITEFGMKHYDDKSILIDDSSDLAYYMAGGIGSSGDIAVRLEYDIMFERNKDKKIKEYLGLALEPYLSFRNYTPYTTNQYPSSYAIIGFKPQVIPGISFQICKMANIEVSVPITIGDLNFGKSYVRNPTWPIREQKQLFLNQTFLRNVFSLRCGVGIGL